MSEQKKKQFNPKWKNKKYSDENKKQNLKIDDYTNFNSHHYLLNIPSVSILDQSKQKNIIFQKSCLGWHLYFDDEYKNNSLTIQKVQTMETFLKTNSKLIIQNNFMNNFSIDINLLYNSEIFLKNWPNFKEELKSKPQYTLNCLGLAVYKFKFDQFDKFNDIEIMNNLVRIRILNYNPIVPLKNIKMNCYEKLISVRGYIIRVNKSQQMTYKIVIACKKCKNSYLIKQKNGIYTIKKKCHICGGMKFDPDFTSPYIQTIALQIVRMQEYFDEKNDDQGQTPRIVDIELHEDLVNTCIPGNDVTITGIVKMQGIDNGKIKISAVSALYIEAVSVVNNSSKSKNDEILNVEFNTHDYKLIKDIHMSLDVLTLLVRSVCPSIYGQEIIKMALLLSLFGGSSQHKNLRSNIHILVLGDPGLGKSQMLKACARIAPKGIYISGNCSTLSGLTVTLVKEAGHNDFALEPGALVLADRGWCCIDEFDKMPSQHQALLEAMEQQRVSIAKSGILWSLPSRTSVLASANPIGGRYDKSKTFCQNVNMSQPLLSRFDLIFLLLDIPNKELDNFLSGHIMLMHTGNENIKNKYFSYPNVQVNKQINSLRNRLITISKNLTQTVSPYFLRTYISYARMYVKPKLSRASANAIKKFYLSLRKIADVSGNLLPCNRQLEALIRLTEARAKLDLREETTEQDAMDVIELMQHSVLHLSKEKKDHIFFQHNKTSRNTTKIFLKLLNNDAHIRNNKLYSLDELNILGMKEGLDKSDVSNAIDKLNDQGFLIKKSKNFYNFCTP